MKNLALVFALLASVALGAVACTGESDEGTPGTPGVPATPKVPDVAALTASVDAAMTAILAKADAADGTTDKVVSKCATCALAMDGSKDHSVKAGEYELHLCSDKCAKGFAADPGKTLSALKLP